MIKKFYYPREKEYYIYYYSNTGSPITVDNRAFDVQFSRNELSDFTDSYGNTYNCRYVFTQPPTTVTPYLGNNNTDIVCISLITYISSHSFINSIVTMGAECFHVSYGGTYLTTVVLPKSLESIGGAAFEHRNALATFYYNGTEAEWDSINFGSSWVRDISPDAVLYYVGGSKPIPSTS